MMKISICKFQNETIRLIKISLMILYNQVISKINSFNNRLSIIQLFNKLTIIFKQDWKKGLKF